MIVLRTDRPLAAAGRAAQATWDRVTRGRRPVTGLDERLLAEQDTIRTVLGRKWRQAVLLTAGRLGLDYGCLLAALRATGAGPRPSLVLLAYSAAGIIALFPVTPGGLGIVEASLSGLLILAGVDPGYAVLVTCGPSQARSGPGKRVPHVLRADAPEWRCQTADTAGVPTGWPRIWLSAAASQARGSGHARQLLQPLAPALVACRRALLARS